jgi:hypothetical protein
MPQISREMLASYLEDSLSTTDTAVVEQALRSSAQLRETLRSVMQELDRGDHTIGAIWRRERLSCPTREQLGTFVLGALDADFQEYIEFHLNTVGCPFCQANLLDLQRLNQEKEGETRKRRQKFFQSSAGYMKVARGAK